MRIRTFAATIAALVAVTVVAAAQDQGGGPGGGRRQGMTMTPPRLAPLPPDSLSAIVTLDDAQRQRYATLYDNFMQSTQPQRDSVRTLMEQVWAARQSGDRAAGQQHRAAMHGLRTQLDQQQKTFDDAVHELLTGDQQKKLADWHAARRSQDGRPPQR